MSEAAHYIASILGNPLVISSSRFDYGNMSGMRNIGQFAIHM
jgi:hypothetical protein